jgi:hypothetical protein
MVTTPSGVPEAEPSSMSAMQEGWSEREAAALVALPQGEERTTSYEPSSEASTLEMERLGAVAPEILGPLDSGAPFLRQE